MLKASGREKEGGVEETIQLEQLAKSRSEKDWEKITLNLDQEKTVWVAVFRAKISQLEGERNLAIVMKASSMEKATEVDYFITNVVEADTPPEMRGKVFGLENNAVNIALSLPLAVAGIAETQFGLRPVLLALAVMAVVGGGFTWYVSRNLSKD